MILVCESALCASTWTVVNVNDSGAGSLRDAISQAAPGDTINITATGILFLKSTITIGPLAASGSGGVTINGPGTSQLMITGDLLAGPSVPGVVAFKDITFHGTVSTNAPMSFTNCTVTAGGVGAIWNGGSLTIVNSTLAANSAPNTSGGAITNHGDLVSINSTLYGNSAPTGGGIDTINTAVTIKGSILGSNTGGNCLATRGGSFTSSGYNISDDASRAPNLTQIGDRNGVGPGIDSGGLRNNGGPTQTLALTANSPAINAIPVAACTLLDGTVIGVDQLGVARPRHWMRRGSIRADVSADDHGIASGGAGGTGGLLQWQAGPGGGFRECVRYRCGGFDQLFRQPERVDGRRLGRWRSSIPSENAQSFHGPIAHYSSRNGHSQPDM